MSWQQLENAEVFSSHMMERPSSAKLHITSILHMGSSTERIRIHLHHTRQQDSRTRKKKTHKKTRQQVTKKNQKLTHGIKMRETMLHVGKLLSLLRVNHKLSTTNDTQRTKRSERLSRFLKLFVVVVQITVVCLAPGVCSPMWPDGSMPAIARLTCWYLTTDDVEKNLPQIENLTNTAT